MENNIEIVKDDALVVYMTEGDVKSILEISDCNDLTDEQLEACYREVDESINGMIDIEMPDIVRRLQDAGGILENLKEKLDLN